MWSKKKPDKYIWTTNALARMKKHKLTPSQVKNTIKRPTRVEEGIAPDTIAVMSSSYREKDTEIWALYSLSPEAGGKIKIVAAWKFKGESPKRDPVPADIMRDVRMIIRS